MPSRRPLPEPISGSARPIECSCGWMRSTRPILACSSIGPTRCPGRSGFPPTAISRSPAGRSSRNCPACRRARRSSKRRSSRSSRRLTASRRSTRPGRAARSRWPCSDDRATLTLDTTGPGLHKRGYRKLAGRAPLKETLAAAMVLLSFWRPDRPLIDPFCGTGTIPIEAALIGRNLAPGLNREFAAEAWPSLSTALWNEARREARDLARGELPVTILGTDVDDEALGLARYHAQLAGVSHDVQFSRRDFRDLSSKRDYGCVIANPPYGERLGDRAEVESLYEAMPEVLRRLKTWSHYILTSHSDFEQLIGQKADRRRKLYNGRIQCTYFQFHGPRPPPTRAGRVGISRGVFRRSRNGPGVWRSEREVARAGSFVSCSTVETGPTFATLSDPTGHHLLSALRARHSRDPAGGRPLRRLPAHHRIRAARTTVRPPSTPTGST